MITIRCAKCKDKVLKYNKIGAGKVLKCLDDRIKRLYGKLDNNSLICSNCNNIIGEIRDGHIKMNQSAFTYGGKVTK